MVKNYESAAAAHKDAINTCMQWNAVLVGGLQEIGHHVWALARSTMETNIETGKAIMNIKSPHELAEIQTKWISQLFNTALSGSAKLSEISTKTTSEAIAPIKSHFSNLVGKTTGDTVDRKAA